MLTQTVSLVPLLFKVLGSRRLVFSTFWVEVRTVNYLEKHLRVSRRILCWLESKFKCDRRSVQRWYSNDIDFRIRLDIYVSISKCFGDPKVTEGIEWTSYCQDRYCSFSRAHLTLTVPECERLPKLVEKKTKSG